MRPAAGSGEEQCEIKGAPVLSSWSACLVARFCLFIVACGTATHAGQVLSEVPDKERYFMYHQCNIQEFYVLPWNAFACFLWISVQTAIILLHNISLLRQNLSFPMLEHKNIKSSGM